ncbi:MAG: hypothetical protein ACLRIS_00605 [Flavonifractor plautii]
MTLEAIGEWGKVQERATFTIEMPPSSSGYDSRLTYTDGDSAAALSDGLFYATGLGDYYGYTFFFDNSGVLRYEMVLEGFHPTVSSTPTWDSTPASAAEKSRC